MVDARGLRDLLILHDPALVMIGNTLFLETRVPHTKGDSQPQRRHDVERKVEVERERVTAALDGEREQG